MNEKVKKAGTSSILIALVSSIVAEGHHQMRSPRELALIIDANKSKIIQIETRQESVTQLLQEVRTDVKRILERLPK